MGGGFYLAPNAFTEEQPGFSKFGQNEIVWLKRHGPMPSPKYATAIILNSTPVQGS